MASQIRASHILLMYRGSSHSNATRSKEEAATDIAALRSQVLDGSDFSDLARSNSDCPSAEDGGDLGFFGRGVMVAAFEDAAFSLQPGETSGVVETPFGFHLIMRTA
jgi:parvulin-like peptidyl-prolyl isomerase